MKKLNVIVVSAVVLMSHTVFGQAALSVGQALDFWVNQTEAEVVSAAEAMPEEKYDFAPSAGEFTGARTFGQQVKHLAANNYRMANYILDRTSTPEQESETGPEAARSKDEIVAYVKGSFAALHSAVLTISASNLVEPSLHRTARQNTKLQFAVDAVAHSYDHYGQMVEYLRMNGIIPPASRRTR